MFLTIATFVCIIIGLLYLWFKIQYDHFVNRGVPGPKPTFPYGNIPNGIFFRRNFIHDWDDIYKEFKGKSSLIGAFEMKSPKFLIIDPEAVKTVFVKKFNNFRNNEFSQMIDKESDPLFGRNPFMLRNEEWKDKRNEVTPAFTPSRIKALFPLVEEVLDRFQKYITKNKNEPLEAREICAKFTTDVVSSCIFNADAESFTKEKPEIREMGGKIFDFNASLIVIFTLYAIFPWLSKIKKIKFVGKNVEDFFVNLMFQAVKQREKDQIKRDDYLAYLMSLRDKKQLSELDIAAHGVTFFTDGFETSSLAISHTLFEIANNSNVQEKLRKEIERIFDENGKIKYEELIENEYLDQVFYESLRMHPPGTIINRECNEETEIDGLNGEKYKIRVGDSLHIPVYSLHYDSEYYPEPEKFKPERFDPEFGGVKAFRDKCVLLPFGDGPRICVGMRFAHMQSKAAIAYVVKNFEMSVNSKTKLPLEMDPKGFLNVKIGGMWLDFKPIN